MKSAKRSRMGAGPGFIRPILKIFATARTGVQWAFGDAGPKDSADESIRRHVIGGAVLVGVLAFGLGGWASTAEISGALIVQGDIVVDSNIKKIQHPTGGVVGQLFVHDGDHVKAGQILIRTR